MNTVQTYFNRQSQQYTEQSENLLWRWLRRRELKNIHSMLGSAPYGNVLELGCGSGFYSRFLAHLGYQHLDAVDFSEAMLTRFDLPNCNKICEDIAIFKNPQPYDLILCAGALEFISNPEQVLQNCAKMIKPTGRIVYLVPKNSILGQGYRLYHLRHGFSIKLFSVEQWLQWANKNALKLVQVKQVFFSLVLHFQPIV